jgi:hypothetical protein
LSCSFSSSARRGADVGQKLLVVPRFLNEVGGAALYGANRVVHGPVRGNHDYRLLRIAATDIGQDLEAVAIRQSKVQQHQVERMFGQLCQPFFAGGSHLHKVAFELQEGFE